MKQFITLNYEQASIYFYYDESAGELLHKISRPGVVAGSIASRPRIDGYKRVSFFGKTYLAHRVVWLLQTGNWPKQLIDHKNGDPSDNHISNLRDSDYVTNGQNIKGPYVNNTTGFLGVNFDKQNKKFRAQIRILGKKINLGLFNTAQEAHNCYLLAKRRHHSFNTI